MKRINVVTPPGQLLFYTCLLNLQLLHLTYMIVCFRNHQTKVLRTIRT